MVEEQLCNRGVALLKKEENQFVLNECNQKFCETFNMQEGNYLSVDLEALLSTHLKSLSIHEKDIKFPISFRNKHYYCFLSLLKDQKIMLSFLEYNEQERLFEKAGMSFWSYDSKGYEDDHHIFTRIHTDDYLRVMDQLSLFIRGKIKEYDYEFRVVEPNNEITWIRSVAFANSRDQDGIAVKIIGLHIYITAYKMIEHNLSYYVMHDALTKTYNRIGIHELMDRYIQKHPHLPLSVLFLDIDNFKKINDIYGHKWGDQALVKMCDAIQLHLPLHAHLARVSGDEFIVFVENETSKEVLGNITHNILEIILHTNAKQTNDDAILTASAGIASYPKDTKDVDELISMADQAMYMAKKRGKAQYIYYSEEIKKAYLEANQMHRLLLEAFKNDEFMIHYQPIMDLENQTPLYYEVLPYWNHPTKGKILPIEFIHTLYEEGLIFAFDEWLIDRCLQDIVLMKEKNMAFVVSINISPKHFTFDNFTKFVESKLNEYQVSGDNLKIEMVEFFLKEDFKAIQRSFSQLKTMGCEIIIDGFGINRSTLSVLTEMQFDTIKINSYFVETVQEEYSSEIIFDTIFKIANDHHKSFIAEGISTLSQLKTVKEKGCRFGQGNVFGDARPLKEIIGE